MIYINPNSILIPAALQSKASSLTSELKRQEVEERNAFVNSKRSETWGHPEVVEALKRVVGNKCWYSEVSSDGSDPEVDHFRPKGRVVEVDAESLEKTGEDSPGYWWLSFDYRNYRLSCKHSNQRRVDKDTEGGKADFLPIEGNRASECTEWDLLSETVLPLDPCSASDMALMWFDPEGNPGLRKPIDQSSSLDKRRMQATIWLYHLKKQDLAGSRAKHVAAIHTKLKEADIAYKLWNPESDYPNLQLRSRFDQAAANIRSEIAPSTVFSGAKRCAVQLAISEYSWIEEYRIVS